MAKYFVCSDIHGAESRLEIYLMANENIDTVIVCGDLEMEVYDVEEIIRRYTSRSIDIRMVRGNCDAYFSSFSKVPDQITVTLSPKHKAMVTHGHLYHANQDLMTYVAQENECDIVIYGHTHRPLDKEEYGIRFLNPGSVRDGSYMIIETDENGDIEVTLN
ncbi:MAG: YfcE family phosphodiesterase [Clostridiales bacterium]|nr:YfcE family phosphodiesterase [Clostridiales bacterium]